MLASRVVSNDLGATFDDELWDSPDEGQTVADLSLFATPDIPELPAIDRFGRFDILGRLARGGMAEIFLAREPGPQGNRHLVLKRILKEYEERADFKEMFLGEAKLATRLYHPNVCHVYECGTADDRTFMALEWVHGVTLRKLIRRAGNKNGIAPELAAHIIAEVAGGLEYVHNAKGVDGRPLNIIHRDVTPHNIMCAWNGRVKLLDFGIAKTSTDRKEERGIRGKYAYLSPEQARGRDIDTRTDVFALGVCLYEALVGKPLYHRDTPPATLRALLEEPPPMIRELRPDLPAELEQIVFCALQKDPDSRYQRAGQMKEDLAAYLARAPGLAGSVGLAAFLDELFEEADKAPLPAKSSRMTGTYTSLTGSDGSGSFGPFGTPGQSPQSPSAQSAPGKAAPGKAAPPKVPPPPPRIPAPPKAPGTANAGAIPKPPPAKAAPKSPPRPSKAPPFQPVVQRRAATPTWVYIVGALVIVAIGLGVGGLIATSFR